MPESYTIKPLEWKRYGQALVAETGCGTYSIRRIRYLNGELTFRAVFRSVGSREEIRISVGRSFRNRLEQCSDDYFATVSRCLTPVPAAGREITRIKGLLDDGIVWHKGGLGFAYDPQHHRATLSVPVEIIVREADNA